MRVGMRTAMRSGDDQTHGSAARSWSLVDRHLRGLGRLVAPVSVDELAAMRRFEVVLRMPGPDGRPGVYGGTVSAPGPSDPAIAAAIVAHSDARDARPFDGVRAEVLRRAGGDDEEPTKQAEVASAAQSEQKRGHQS